LGVKALPALATLLPLAAPFPAFADEVSECVRFVSLYGGTGVGPIFVWLLPD
jgi:hypothetical protein